MLEQIIEHKRLEIVRKKAYCPLERVKEAVAFAPPVRDFRASLRQPGRVAVIAEIKRASPSKGPIRPDADPVAVGKMYAAAGAAAISVLTDERFFAGHPGFLGAVRQTVVIPVLCKEFILDPYQIYEARFLGADAVLLIVRLLRQRELVGFLELARALGMECLVEVHTRDELQRALDAGAAVIGINNRDLQTFTTDIKTTLRLRRHIPPEVIAVSESGISSPLAMHVLREHGVDAVLIGEALMSAADPAAKLRELLDAGTG